MNIIFDLNTTLPHYIQGDLELKTIEKVKGRAFNSLGTKYASSPKGSSGDKYSKRNLSPKYIFEISKFP